MAKAKPQKVNEFLVNFERFLKILLTAIVTVVVLHIFWQLVVGPTPQEGVVLTEVSWRFGLDFELSIPTWLSSVLALMFAGLAWLVASNQVNRLKKHTWYWLSALGLFVSLDELSALHELVLQALHIAAGFGEQQDLLRNAWLLLLPLIALGALWFIPRIKRGLPEDTFNNLVAAFGVYLAGALVVEYFSSPFDETTLFYRVVLVVAEESMEMIGLWLMIRAVGQHVGNHEPSLSKNLLATVKT